MSILHSIAPGEGQEAEEEESPPQLVRKATDFHQAISRLVRVWMFRERHRAGSHDLSTSGVYALEVLVRLGKIGINDLAAELFVEKSTASRIVAGLEEKGYVVRRLDPDDRRSLRIEVTDLGQALHRRIHQDNVRDVAQLLAESAVDDGALTRQLREIARTSAGETSA